MDLQNKQADQLEQLTSMVTNNLNMLDNLQDPIEKMMDKSKKFGNRIRTNDKVKFFKDSQKLMNKVLHGSSTKKGSVEGSISVDGDLEGLNDSINKTTKNTNEFFDNLLNVRIGEELPYMMNEFNDSHLERISELDEEYESMFNRQADLHDFERDVEDSFEDIKDTTGDFFNFFDEKMGAIGLDSASILGAAGIGGGVINIGGAIKEGVDKNLEVMEKFRRMTGSTKEEWKDFKNLLYEDTSEINERFENYQFGSTQRMDAVDDVLNTGITDPNKIRQVSDSVMMMNALSENVDLSGFEFLQTQLYQLSSEDASGLTEYLTEFAASVADLKGVDPEDVFESFDEYGKSIKAVTSNNREFRRHIENLTEFGLALQTTGMAEGTM
jgi:phage-related protein